MTQFLKLQTISILLAVLLFFEHSTARQQWPTLFEDW